MRTARTILLAVATSTLLALTACGDSEEDKQTESEQRAEKYLQSLIDRDGDVFCSLVEVEGVPVSENDEVLKACVEMSDASIPELEDDFLKEAEKSIEEGPETSTEDGDKAEVTYGTGDDTFDIELVRIDGDWFVTLV